jgi:hypothetical protein
MKILTTKAQLRYTIESARRIVFEPQLPVPPDGLVYLQGADGAFLQGGDGAYLLGSGLVYLVGADGELLLGADGFYLLGPT